MAATALRRQSQAQASAERAAVLGAAHLLAELPKQVEGTAGFKTATAATPRLIQVVVVVDAVQALPLLPMAAPAAPASSS
jgi:hypothetical protein